MRIEEINKQILDNTNKMRQLQKEVAELSKQNSSLGELKNQKLLDFFFDWIQLDQQFNITSYISFSGVPTGKTKSELTSSYFHSGDVISVIKKNEKSVIIQVVKKIKSTTDSTTGKKISTTTNPNWTFRVHKSEFYNSIISRFPEIKNNFDSYVKRTESLNQLLES
jgi:hypothetical protein